VRELIDAALGIKPDLVIRNVNLVNVMSGEIYPTDIAIKSGLIAGLGKYQAGRTIDGTGKYAVPGLIDSHVHIESSALTLTQFARAVLLHGVTCVIVDPHEIANVLGIRGVRLMLDEAQTLPLRVFIMVPSCVPSCELETSGSWGRTRLRR
jgi:adenine deaminase